jgi:hypothetical protein
LKQKVSGDPLFDHLLGAPFLDGKVFQDIVIAAIDGVTTSLLKYHLSGPHPNCPREEDFGSNSVAPSPRAIGWRLRRDALPKR